MDENEMIKNIITASDWREVIATIVTQENMDPWKIDIVKLTDNFVTYLKRLEEFSFRIPARFILVAAILLRIKCELLFEEDKKEKEISGEEIPQIDINKVPRLPSPMERKTTRKVTLDELITALDKAMRFKERKERKRFRMRRAIETLIEPEEDIEIRIERIFKRIKKSGEVIRFSRLVPKWKRIKIVETFIPLLHLSSRGNITMEQEKMFDDIFIKMVFENEK
jgi:segregation and condensation protein A